MKAIHQIALYIQLPMCGWSIATGQYKWAAFWVVVAIGNLIIHQPEMRPRK